MLALQIIRLLGRRALERIEGLGRATIMWALALWGLPNRTDISLLFQQIYNLGVLSLVIIILSAFSIGAVLALQFYTQLVRFGAQEAVGVGLAMVLLRELGPVVTALLFAGRAGSAITAEIGLMKSTEQLSSMEMMGVDPLRRIVAPRLWAGIISLPLLTAIFNVVAIYGGAIVSIEWLGVDPGGFWSGMTDFVQLWNDIGKGMVKALVFAIIVTWIAVYQGYDTLPTAEGIGLATTRTVVHSSVMILAMDFVLTLTMYGDFN
ncbi:MAG: lipid asymmetry maintenance ABC transporter permease subunit MlaE [Gammaproteobacteria bacterium]|nr:lipid asymmetry maintenance ABC transporter permease subunit MlaE [Gammaproteobacteria bacterium]